MKTRLKKIRIIWILGLAVLVIALLWLAIAPFGTITYHTDFLSRDYFIGRLTPVDRLAGREGEDARTITSEPVYFSLFTPRPFRRAIVTVEYDKPVAQLELGIRRDAVVWNYEKKPLSIEALDVLAADPRTLSEDTTLLWQKKKTYTSVEDFRSALPSVDQYASYDFPLIAPYRISDYSVSSKAKSYNLSARGNYIMNIYSGGEAIDMTFFVYDLNLSKDPDPISVVVYDTKGTVVTEAELADDVGAERVTSPLRNFQIKSTALNPGAYRLEFKAGDDIITDQIETRQNRFSFANRLWLANAKRKNIVIYTDVSDLIAQTSAAAGKQTLSFEGERLSVSETYTQFKSSLADRSRRLKTIILERDDLILAGDGAFAFSPDTFINPSPRQFSTSIENAGVDFIIARYEPQTGLRRSASFDLSSAYREKGAYSFLLSAPGIEDVSGGLEIRSISVQLEGETLFGFLKKYFNRL